MLSCKANFYVKCKHLSKECHYTGSPRVPPTGSEDIALLYQRIEILEQRLEKAIQKRSNRSLGDTPWSEQSHLPPQLPDAYEVEFPIRYFLDYEVYQQVHIDQLNSGLSVPAEILNVLQSKTAMHNLCDIYMSTIQTWLPILSKKRIFESLYQFDERKDASFVLLLLSMKLVSEIPPERDHAAQSSLYCTSKGLQSRLERSRAISLQLLQSTILIAVYEIGHGMYPAGYLSISFAARLGIIMGPHEKKGGTRLLKEAQTWTQCEEERRVWWAVFLLERYVCKDVYQDVTDLF
jgi:hypothetical protein